MLYQENTIYHCDCLDLAQIIPEKSLNLILTSPPYANQRKNQYGGLSEQEYPQWTVDWMNAFIPTLTENASVAIIIRPNIKNGQISDYVLKTRLAIREAGWFESEELIWIKPDAPPLGHLQRPRRSWESILWFSRSIRPFCNPQANGTVSNRIGFESTKGIGDYKNGTTVSKTGIARCKDYVEIGTSASDKSKFNTHPAQFPEKLANWIIKLLNPPQGLVCDPFMGSGTTALACQNLNVPYVGSEIKSEYINIANHRIKKIPLD